MVFLRTPNILLKSFICLLKNTSLQNKVLCIEIVVFQWWNWVGLNSEFYTIIPMFSLVSKSDSASSSEKSESEYQSWRSWGVRVWSVSPSEFLEYARMKDRWMARSVSPFFTARLKSRTSWSVCLGTLLLRMYRLMQECPRASGALKSKQWVGWTRKRFKLHPYPPRIWVLWEVGTKD